MVRVINEFIANFIVNMERDNVFSIIRSICFGNMYFQRKGLAGK